MADELQTADTNAERDNLITRTVEFVEGMFDEAVDVKAALNAAVNAKLFMDTFREKVAVAATRHIPAIVDNMADIAKSGSKGSVQAAKVLLEVTGVIKGARTNVNLANINVLPEEMDRIRGLASKKVGAVKEVIDIGHD